MIIHKNLFLHLKKTDKIKSEYLALVEKNTPYKKILTKLAKKYYMHVWEVEMVIKNMSDIDKDQIEIKTIGLLEAETDKDVVTLFPCGAYYNGKSIDENYYKKLLNYDIIVEMFKNSENGIKIIYNADEIHKVTILYFR